MTTSQQGRLILVPTPLDFGIEGAAAPADLRDLLSRSAIATAARLNCWVVENAKTARAFLKRVNAIEALAQPLQTIQIAELPRPQKGARPARGGADEWRPLLAPATSGHDLGLMSEAGMPAIADPGAGLVAAAHLAGIEVVALPGPNSLMLCLAASGLNGQSFAFVGYLPIEAAARAARIKELEAASRRQAQTQLIIETPYRNEALLGALLANASGDTRLSISCGLTLPGGWSRTLTVARWKAGSPTLPANVPAVFALLAA